VSGEGGQWLPDGATEFGFRWWDGAAFTMYVRNELDGPVFRDPGGLHKITAPATRRPVVLPPDVEAYTSPAQTHTHTHTHTHSDAIADGLEVFGWLGLVGSIVIGIAFVAWAGSEAESPGLGLLLGFAGLMQSLLVVGFARIIRYTKQSADLLQIAVQQLS
jgi:hypothetical protein